MFCCLPSGAYAGGVHFGFGVDVPLPGHVVAAPVELYSPPVVVERTAPKRVVVEEVVPPERVVIERKPLRRVVIEQPASRVVVVEPVPPGVVYEEPVVVERRSSVTTYYRRAPVVREYHEETEREYYGRGSRHRADDDEY